MLCWLSRSVALSHNKILWNEIDFTLCSNRKLIYGDYFHCFIKFDGIHCLIKPFNRSIKFIDWSWRLWFVLAVIEFCLNSKVNHTWWISDFPIYKFFDARFLIFLKDLFPGFLEFTIENQKFSMMKILELFNLFCNQRRSEDSISNSQLLTLFANPQISLISKIIFPINSNWPATANFVFTSFSKHATSFEIPEILFNFCIRNSKTQLEPQE